MCNKALQTPEVLSRSYKQNYRVLPKKVRPDNLLWVIVFLLRHVVAELHEDYGGLRAGGAAGGVQGVVALS